MSPNPSLSVLEDENLQGKKSSQYFLPWNSLKTIQHTVN